MPLDAIGRFSPAGGGVVDFGSIDIIAHAMDHAV